MIYIVENIVAILFATIAGFVFGAAWYGALSGPWLRAVGLSGERARNASKTIYAVAFALEFWIASILAGAIILAPPEAGEWTMAIGSAVVIWIGFVLPTTAVNNLSALRPKRLIAIDAGHWLGVFLVQVVVMKLWGLVAPAAATA